VPQAAARKCLRRFFVYKINMLRHRVGFSAASAATPAKSLISFAARVPQEAYILRISAPLAAGAVEKGKRKIYKRRVSHSTNADT
jgi:hypothetical protein